MSKTKAEVLAMAKDIKGTVDFPDQDWFPEVHALTDSQFSRIQGRMMAQQVVTVAADGSKAEVGQVRLDLGALIENDFESRVMAVVFGMEEKWSENEVRKIPISGAIEKISNKIFELGGHDLMQGLQPEVRDRVTRFRKERDRTRHVDATFDRDPSGEEPAEDDDSTKVVHGASSASSKPTEATVLYSESDDPVRHEEEASETAEGDSP